MQDKNLCYQTQNWEYLLWKLVLSNTWSKITSFSFSCWH